jgi:crotonobetainyl-CoA:carnitine CoA-transferase CaiB-like acyl-CoA transferase
VVNHPVLYDGATAEVERPPQQLGAQTAEVLTELGFTSSEIRALADERIITTGTAS